MKADRLGGEEESPGLLPWAYVARFPRLRRANLGYQEN
jgi:hypothetical protein